MANPCDKRVQQLTASLTQATKAVDGLNAQVTQQMQELDAYVVQMDEKLAHIQVQAQVIQNQQNEIVRLQALLDTKTPPPPAEQTISPQSGDVNAHVNDPEVGR
jgi:hypothetical protein